MIEKSDSSSSDYPKTIYLSSCKSKKKKNDIASKAFEIHVFKLGRKSEILQLIIIIIIINGVIFLQKPKLFSFEELSNVVELVSVEAAPTARYGRKINIIECCWF